MTFINTVEDMTWLADIHLKDRPDLTDEVKAGRLRSAVIHGNEDAPKRIDLYPAADPLYTDIPTTVTLSED